MLQAQSEYGHLVLFAVHSCGHLIVMQAAYANADAASEALQAVAPTGVTHFQIDKLVLFDKAA